MFAVCATHADPLDPISALQIGERPDPIVPGGWIRVKISHASLNRHDPFTLRGISGHPEGIKYPIILGNDGAGILDDGTPVVIYPLMGSDGWRRDATLDPKWHIPSEFIDGTFADYTVVPSRNVIRLPEGLSPLHASVLGTAWLTAYRALFTKSGLRPGETVLIQGATGGMATALIQLGEPPVLRSGRLVGRKRAGDKQEPSALSKPLLPTNLCRGKCRPSWTMSVRTPGHIVFHRSPEVAR